MSNVIKAILQGQNIITFSYSFFCVSKLCVISNEFLTKKNTRNKNLV